MAEVKLNGLVIFDGSAIMCREKASDLLRQFSLKYAVGKRRNDVAKLAEDISKPNGPVSAHVSNIWLTITDEWWSVTASCDHDVYTRNTCTEPFCDNHWEQVEQRKAL